MVDYVYGTWCGPCQVLAPLYEALYAKYNSEGICSLVKENVDLKLSVELIQVVPTLLFYFNGKLQSKITGADLVEIEQRIVDLHKALMQTPASQPPNES